MLPKKELCMRRWVAAELLCAVGQAQGLDVEECQSDG